MSTPSETGFDSNRDSNHRRASANAGGGGRSRGRKRGNDEGSVYQRKDGRWVASATGPDGKRVSRYARTRSDAAAKLIVVLKAAQDGVPLPPDRQTVKDFLEAWVSETLPGSVRPATLASYASIVRHHLVPELGPMPLTRLTPQHVQQLMTRKSDAGLSPRRVTYIRGVLRQALGVALRWGMVSRNVATLVRPPRAVRFEIRPLDPDQTRTFLEFVAPDRLAALYIVALAVGLRQGEVLGLRWEDVDLDAGELRVRHALQRIDGKLQLVEPKTTRSRRTNSIPAFAVESLRAHRARQGEERDTAGQLWEDHGLVFTTLTGSPLDASYVTKAFQRHIERAGLPRQRFHDLRHACASHLLAQGINPRVVMDVLGHSQIGLTLNTYSHVIPRLKEDAADRMDALFRRPPD